MPPVQSSRCLLVYRLSPVMDHKSIYPLYRRAARILRYAVKDVMGEARNAMAKLMTKML